jgi:prefoldin subunit 5
MDDLNQQIGRLEAHVEALQQDMSELRADVKQLSQVVTKWKGAGVLLLILGASFGWLVDALLKLR